MNIMHRSDSTLLQPGAAEPEPFLWVPEVAGFLRRRWRLMGACTAVALLAGGAYVVTTPPSYTATTALLIDSRRADSFRGQPQIADGMALNGLVESQAEVLRSEGIARTVVDRLQLLSDPAFNAQHPSGAAQLIAALRGLLPAQKSAASTDEARETAAVQHLLAMTSVRRIGLTYVIELDVTAGTPDEAARLARGVTDAYLADELGARSAATRQATSWLQDRIGELRDQALAADRAVQAYKARTNIVDTGRGGLMNEQQLSELDSQLVAAQGRVAEARARLDRIQAVDAAGSGAVPDALQSTLITSLRQRYLDDARQEAAWSAQYGRNHEAAVKMRAEMAELQGAIRSEVARIARSYESAFDIARADEAAIQAKLDGLTGAAGQTNSDLAMLRSLQSSADTYRALYGSFLQRYTQAAQDQSFPLAEARVISAAEPPLRKSAPRTGVVLAGAAVLGLALGTALAFLREALENGLRTAADVRVATGLPFLGALPRLRSGWRARARGAALLGTVAARPDSPFAMAIARMRLRVLRRRLARGSAVIGCIAPRPGEGTTVVAANLAHSLAAGGRPTILVDLACGAHAAAALMPDALERPDPATGLTLRRLSPTLGADQLAAELRVLREAFEFVVVDLPAIDPPSPVHEALDAIDGFVVVARWGRTDRSLLAEALARAELDEARMLGVVLAGAEGTPTHASAPHCA